MHVAICIVDYNNADEVLACIGSLGATKYRDFEVVVCENGSAASFESLGARLSTASDVQVIHAPSNPGYAGGVNRCIAATGQADAWWVLNPDARPEPQTLGALVDRLKRGDAEAVGGPICYPDGSLQAAGGRWRGAIARVVSLGKGTDAAAPLNAAAIEAEINFIHGASMLVSRRFLELVGPMREDYFLYCEEVEWGVRAVRRGVKLGFEPVARVLHNQGSTTGSADDMRHRPWLPTYLDERNKMLLVKDTRPIQLVTAAPAALVLLALRYGRLNTLRSLRHAVSGWWAGLLGERDKPRALRP
jgi:N-acetylglucosaminyl-diphospho-decaprenol L-rhamnosyltransferase